METRDWAPLLVAIAAMIVTGLAAYYGAWGAKTAYDAYRQARELFVEQNQPYVFVDLRSDERQPGLVMVYIKNQGPTVAESIRVTFEPPLVFDPEYRSGKLLREIEIPALPPGGVQSHLVGFGARFLAVNLGPSMVTVTATGRHGPIERLRYPLELQRNAIIGHKTTNDIAIAMERIASALESNRLSAATFRIADVLERAPVSREEELGLGQISAPLEPTTRSRAPRSRPDSP